MTHMLTAAIVQVSSKRDQLNKSCSERSWHCCWLLTLALQRHSALLSRQGPDQGPPLVAGGLPDTAAFARSAIIKTGAPLVEQKQRIATAPLLTFQLLGFVFCLQHWAEKSTRPTTASGDGSQCIRAVPPMAL